MGLNKLVTAKSAAFLSVVAISAAGCSSSSSSTAGSSTSPTAAAAATSSAAPVGSVADASYTGPESSLPKAFSAPTKKAGYSFTIGWLVPNGSIPSLQTLTTGIQSEAAALGGKVIVLDSQLNPQTEVNNFNQLLAENVTGIISFPLNPQALAPSLAQAKAKGIPVISIDAPASASDPLIPGYFATILLSRDRGASALAAKAAAVSPGGQFALLGIAAPIPSLNYVIAREKYWAQKDGMKLAGEVDSQADTSAGATQALSSILAKYPNVRTVFTYNDVSGVGAAAQTRVNGSTDVKVFGFDGEDEALQSIKAGGLYGTYEIPFAQDGVQAVDALYETLTDKSATLPPRISDPGQLVTR